jgi:hypothetical protein
MKNSQFSPMAQEIFAAGFLSLRPAFDATYWLARSNGSKAEHAFYLAAARVMADLRSIFDVSTTPVHPVADEDAQEAAEEATVTTFAYLADDATIRNIERIREALHAYEVAGMWTAKFVWPDMEQGPMGTLRALAGPRAVPDATVSVIEEKKGV